MVRVLSGALGSGNSRIIQQYSTRRAVSTGAQTNKAFKGFGEQPKRSSEASVSADETAKTLLKLEKSGKQKKKPDPARPVDPQEASQGRVDIVQVKDWGTGNRDDLGSLQVESASLAYAAKDGRPLYEQLGRALELAQAQGLMKIANGGAPPPPFERWSFREGRYRQYITDLACVHQALEAAIAAVTAAPPHDVSTGPGSASAASDPVAPLRRFTATLGLQRSEQIQRDIAALASTAGTPSAEGPTADPEAVEPGAAPRSAAPEPPAAATRNSMAGEASSTQPAAAPAPAPAAALAPSSAAAPAAPAPAAPAPAAPAAPAATQMATAYATYIGRLAVECTSASTPGAAAAAAARLLAHVYAVHASHLITGMRIGAAAAEKLCLVQRAAFHLYNTYPRDVPDPAKTFIKNVNAAGLVLGPQAREDLFAELPQAWQKTCLLMSALAHVN